MLDDIINKINISDIINNLLQKRSLGNFGMSLIEMKM